MLRDSGANWAGPGINGNVVTAGAVRFYPCIRRCSSWEVAETRSHLRSVQDPTHSETEIDWILMLNLTASVCVHI